MDATAQPRGKHVFENHALGVEEARPRILVRHQDRVEVDILASEQRSASETAEDRERVRRRQLPDETAAGLDLNRRPSR
jgi:hypothetical protein